MYQKMIVKTLTLIIMLCR